MCPKPYRAPFSLISGTTYFLESIHPWTREFLFLRTEPKIITVSNQRNRFMTPVLLISPSEDVPPIVNRFSDRVCPTGCVLQKIKPFHLTTPSCPPFNPIEDSRRLCSTLSPASVAQRTPQGPHRCLATPTLPRTERRIYAKRFCPFSLFDEWQIHFRTKNEYAVFVHKLDSPPDLQPGHCLTLHFFEYLAGSEGLLVSYFCSSGCVL